MPKYYILDAQNPKRMLLSSLEDPGLDDNWFWGRRFVEPPEEPIFVPILDGYEKAELMDYFGTPPVMSQRFYDALLRAGVSNLDVFDAILSDDSGDVRHEGYKAFNLIGIIAAAGSATEYSADNESRLIDASIEKLSIDEKAAHGALMFRLAEYAGAVIVHESVKRAIEREGFAHVVFREPEDFIS
jgi:hypothetical protein